MKSINLNLWITMAVVAILALGVCINVTAAYGL